MPRARRALDARVIAEVRARCPVRGWGAVTVPGAVSAWATLSERFGNRLKTCCSPPSETAERSYADATVVQEQMGTNGAGDGACSPGGFAEAFLPRRRARSGRALLLSVPAARGLRDRCHPG